MDWKTKALLFVLVLFGSVVPASAADGGGTTADVWAIIAARGETPRRTETGGAPG